MVCLCGSVRYDIGYFVLGMVVLSVYKKKKGSKDEAEKTKVEK